MGGCLGHCFVHRKSKHRLILGGVLQQPAYFETPRSLSKIPAEGGQPVNSILAPTSQVVSACLDLVHGERIAVQ